MNDSKKIKKINGLVSRRQFIAAAGLAAGHLAFPFNCGSYSSSISHPRIFIREDGKGGLPDVEYFKRLKNDNLLAKSKWDEIQKRVSEIIDKQSLTPCSLFEGRREDAARAASPDYSICHEAGQRLLQFSITALLENNTDAKNAALRLLEVFFDDYMWPEWMDKAHVSLGYPADLRTGMLGQDVALAYDWLYPLLSTAERADILTGLRKKAVEPYLKAINMDPWWINDLNNWLTVIVGGLGIAGMATDGELPEAKYLIEIADPLMKEYSSLYGPEGEFNESPFYGGSNRLLVGYYQAERFWLGGEKNQLIEFPIPKACRWILQTTLPPGRPMSFGDSKGETPVQVGYISAVAAANSDPVLQWFYKQYAQKSTDPRDFLWPDFELEEISPQAKEPLGKAFIGHGGILVSRSSWDPIAPTCIVYGKTGKEPHHQHNDVGQLCIDSFGKRLIIDIGSPSVYPEDYFLNHSRWNYYNASIRSHNVLMINGAEQLDTRSDKDNGGPGILLWSNFNESLGGAWNIDLSKACPEAIKVERSVIHLLPGIVAVIDTAVMPEESEFSLRWHSIIKPKILLNDTFVVKNESAVTISRIIPLSESTMETALNYHKYEPPYDKNRLGNPLEQRNEPYFEASTFAKEVQWMTLFAVGKNQANLTGWQKRGQKWSIDWEGSNWEIAVSDQLLSVEETGTGRSLEVPITLPTVYPLWNEHLKIPDKNDISLIEGVEFSVVKPYEFEKDGYRFLHGVAIIWHKGNLFASFAHNKDGENTSSEEVKYCISKDEGKTWSEIKRIGGGGNVAISHGEFVSHNGELWSFNGEFDGIMQNLRTRAFRYHDEMDNWEDMGIVTRNNFWPTAEPEKMDDGNWIMPGAQINESYGGKNPPAVAITKGDDFSNWEVIEIPPNMEEVWGECSLMIDGSKILLVSRWGGKSWALVSESNDYGRTWNKLQASNLPMVTSKCYTGQLSNGMYYLIGTTYKGVRFSRIPLTIALSRPGEMVFSKVFAIRDAEYPEGPGESHPDVVLAYPHAYEYQGYLYVGYSNNGGYVGRPDREGRKSLNNNSAELAKIPINKLVLDD